MQHPTRSVARFLPTLIVLGFGFYLFTDPQGAAVAVKAALKAVTTGAQHLAEFIRALSE